MTIFYLVSGIIFLVVSLLFVLISSWGIVAFCLIAAAFCFYMRSREKKKASEPSATTVPERVEKPQGNIEHHRVAGVSYRQDDIISLGDLNPLYDEGKSEIMEEVGEDEKVFQYEFYPDKVELVPDPDNEHDKNAIKVMIDDVHVGFIKAGSCAHIKKLLDENKIEDIDAEIYGGKYKVIYDGKLEKDSTDLIAIELTLKVKE